MFIKKQYIKRILDLAMIFLLLLLMAYSLVGETAHEWLGVAMGITFMTHHWLNTGWYMRLAKGRWGLARAFRAAINLALLLIMLGLMFSGIILSKEVFVFLPISSGRSFARTLHLLCSYWGFCLMGLHIGTHWSKAIGIVQQKVRMDSRKRIILLRGITILFAGYGVCAFFRREIGSYMLLKIVFVFFDFEEPLILFLLDYLAVMGLFAVVGYYLLKIFQKVDLIW